MRVRTLGIAVLLLVAACGGGDKKDAGGRASETAEATSAPAAGESAAPASGAAETAATGTAKPATAKPAAPSGGTVAAAPAGQSNIPKAGKYVYLTSGTQEGVQPGATPTTYKDRETTVEFLEPKDADGGKEQKYRAGGEQGTSTTTTRWEKSRVLLLSVSFTSPQGNIECKFNTPAGGLEVAKFPIKAEKFPRQEWKNEQCEGSHEQEIVKEETVTAQGRSWKTWKILTTTRIKITFTSPGGGPLPPGPQTIDTNVQSTQWLAPDLGTEVKSDSVNDFTFGGSTSKGNTARELKSFP